ncbi:unnamed protein product [Lota lota]
MAMRPHPPPPPTPPRLIGRSGVVETVSCLSYYLSSQLPVPLPQSIAPFPHLPSPGSPGSPQAQPGQSCVGRGGQRLPFAPLLSGG